MEHRAAEGNEATDHGRGDPKSQMSNPGSPPGPRTKLGLALAGGGFRASLFHLGVLRRMAELDLLPHVEVLSTVSGGSIIGALYILLLKRWLDVNAWLTRDDYVEIVKELQETLITGIQRNLRTRLFWNPFGLLRVLLTQHSLGKRMARLYERYLYRDAVEQLQPRPWWNVWRPGRIRLREVRFAPGGNPMTAGLEAYNASPATPSKVPNLILNATSLNSGKPFRFSCMELGDPQLGFFHHDEIEAELRPRKRLLQEVPIDSLKNALTTMAAKVTIQQRDYPYQMALYAAWWRDYPTTPPPLNTGVPGFPGALAMADFGILRQAKLAAWYLRRGLSRTPQVTGGVSSSVHLQRFWEALRTMDEDLTAALQTQVTTNPGLQDELLDFILELYYLRTAKVMSPRIEADWDRLALSDAVGASACFPPVFPPFVVLGFYDDLWVTRLGLTDGGVYDNLGITTLLDEGCTYIIASDTGGLFDIEPRVSGGHLGMSARIASSLMDDVAELQRTALRERRRVSRAIVGVDSHSVAGLHSAYQLAGLAYFHIHSPPLDGPGLPLGLDRNVLARLRTDLDAFGEIEVAALVNHGYDTADRYIRKYLEISPYVDPAYWQPPISSPLPFEAHPDRVQRVLVAGHARFFRALKLWAFISWLFTLAVVGAIVWKTWHLRLSMRDVITWLASRAMKWIEGIVPFSGPRWVDYSIWVGGAVLVVIGTGWIARVVWPWLIARFGDRFPRPTRKFVFAIKWVRSYAMNLLWLLGGAPLWIAFGGAAVAWISYIFYALPFLSKTRNR